MDKASEEEHEEVSDKMLRSFKEIEIEDDNEEDEPQFVKVKGIRNKKSILKNKNTSIFIAPVTK